MSEGSVLRNDEKKKKEKNKTKPLPCQRARSRGQAFCVRALEGQAALSRAAVGRGGGICCVFQDKLGVRRDGSVFSAEAVKVFRMISVGRLWGKREF